MRFKPLGLPPQMVADDVYSEWATGDTFQRKVMYNGSYFWVAYWNGVTNGSPYYIYSKASADGIIWEASVAEASMSVGPCGNKDAGGNLDYLLASNILTYKIFIGSTEITVYQYSGAISESTITWTALWGASYANVTNVSINVCRTLGGRIYSIQHGRHTVTLIDSLYLLSHTETFGRFVSGTTVPPKSTSNGGGQLLPYKTSSPYNCLYLLVDANSILYYTILDDSTRALSLPMTSLVTVVAGFNSFCAASEAQVEGDSEVVHLVYIKSTGELCYRKFQNDAFYSEKVLVTSGATYPVIAVGSNGKLYVFYVKDGKIWGIRRKGAWSRSVELFTDDHTYNNPAYLSSNQNVQNGKICLVWTEGTASPYEVWFTYLID